jgi:3-deoxy-manno-octulosonate cytidylyltransferase (CMP-KDO synthetase)
VIGLQADEPFIPHTIIGDLAKDLSSNAQHTIASICTQLTSADDLLNPNIVKVVLDKNCNAIYFSRAAIPSKLGGATLSRLHYKHIGIYGYRVNFLQDYIAWGPCALEQAESLEQLRILWHGERIHMNICNAIPGGIDTLQQYEAIRCINTES